MEKTDMGEYIAQNQTQKLNDCKGSNNSIYTNQVLMQPDDMPDDAQVESTDSERIAEAIHKGYISAPNRFLAQLNMKYISFYTSISDKGAKIDHVAGHYAYCYIVTDIHDYKPYKKGMQVNLNPDDWKISEKLVLPRYDEPYKWYETSTEAIEAAGDGWNRWTIDVEIQPNGSFYGIRNALIHKQIGGTPYVVLDIDEGSDSTDALIHSLRADFKGKFLFFETKRKISNSLSKHQPNQNEKDSGNPVEIEHLRGHIWFRLDGYVRSSIGIKGWNYALDETGKRKRHNIIIGGKIDLCGNYNARRIFLKPNKYDDSSVINLNESLEQLETMCRDDFFLFVLQKYMLVTDESHIPPVYEYVESSGYGQYGLCFSTDLPSDDEVKHNITCLNSVVKSIDDYNNLAKKEHRKLLDVSHDTKDWQTIGFALGNDLKEHGRSIFHNFSCYYDKHGGYDSDTCDRLYNSIMDEVNKPPEAQRNKKKAHIASIYFIIKKVIKANNIELAIPEYEPDIAPIKQAQSTKIAATNQLDKYYNTNNQMLNSVEGVAPVTSTPAIKGIKGNCDILNYLVEKCEPVDFNVIIYESIQEFMGNTKQGINLISKYSRDIVVREALLRANLNNYGMVVLNGLNYLYNGEYWTNLTDEEIKSFLCRCAIKMGLNPLIAYESKYIQSLYEQFQATTCISQPEFDKSKVIINLRNGSYEISDERQGLRDFSPFDYLTYQLSFDYDPEAQAPMFMKFLNEVLPDKSLQDILAEYLGYVLLRHNARGFKCEKCLILLGNGANGKSVLYEIVNALLGAENISHYSLSQLTDTSGYYRAGLAHVLLNYTSELSKFIDSELFKMMISGEPMIGRFPFGRPFAISVYAKLIFNANELPVVTDQSYGFFRRFMIIPFDVTIPPEKQDKNLHKKIIDSELAGVFNWILAGLNRLLSQGDFSYSKASEDALNAYREESDNVKQFIKSNNYQPSEHRMDAGELYFKYTDYCKNNGFHACNVSTFGKRLTAMGFKSGKSGERYYLMGSSFQNEIQKAVDVL
jgi:putative DNA primase/helicase